MGCNNEIGGKNKIDYKDSIMTAKTSPNNVQNLLCQSMNSGRDIRLVS